MLLAVLFSCMNSLYLNTFDVRNRSSLFINDTKAVTPFSWYKFAYLLKRRHLWLMASMSHADGEKKNHGSLIKECSDQYTSQSNAPHHWITEMNYWLNLVKVNYAELQNYFYSMQFTQANIWKTQQKISNENNKFKFRTLNGKLPCGHSGLCTLDSKGKNFKKIIKLSWRQGHCQISGEGQSKSYLEWR